jgi:hypothetical protein
MPPYTCRGFSYDDLTARGADAGRQVPLRLRYCYFYLHADGRRRDSTNRFTPTMVVKWGRNPGTPEIGL